MTPEAKVTFSQALQIADWAYRMQLARSTNPSTGESGGYVKRERNGNVDTIIIGNRRLLIKHQARTHFGEKTEKITMSCGNQLAKKIEKAGIVKFPNLKKRK